MEEGGFEPPKSLTADLQSVPFGHSGTPPYSVKVELVGGIEPSTCALQVRCSTFEPHQRVSLIIITDSFYFVNTYFGGML